MRQGVTPPKTLYFIAAFGQTVTNIAANNSMNMFNIEIATLLRKGAYEEIVTGGRAVAEVRASD